MCGAQRRFSVGGSHCRFAQKNECRSDHNLRYGGRYDFLSVPGFHAFFINREIASASGVARVTSGKWIALSWSRTERESAASFFMNRTTTPRCGMEHSLSSVPSSYGTWFVYDFSMRPRSVPFRAIHVQAFQNIDPGAAESSLGRSLERVLMLVFFSLEAFLPLSF